jgi:hypothetical protein
LLGSYLQRRSSERQIRYSKYHERRAEVLEDLYGLVVKARREFPQNAPLGNRVALNKSGWEFLDALAELRGRYEEAVLWLDEDTKRQIERFLDETLILAEQWGRASDSEPVTRFTGFKLGEMKELAEKDPEAAAEFTAGFEEVLRRRKEIAADLEELRATIEAKFRAALKEG